MALKPKTKQLIWSLVTLVVLAALTAFLNTRGGSDDGWVGEPGTTRASASEGPTSAASRSPDVRSAESQSAESRSPESQAPESGPASGAPASSEVPDDRRTGTDPDSGLPWVSPGDLPPEAGDTIELIYAGGPFPFPRNDDQTFSNRERLLPDRPNGYYREYTVITPGSDDRGARRIIGGEQGELYYTDDHYDSFRRVAEAG